MLVVLVVYLEVCVGLLAPPVGHDVEWTGVGPGQRSYLVLQDINIEVGSLGGIKTVRVTQLDLSECNLWIQLGLLVQQVLQIAHVELEHQCGVRAGVLHF